MTIHPHLMIDIETLGTQKDSIILSIGAVRFDIGSFSPSSLHVGVQIAWQSAAAKRTITGDAFFWWLQQSDAARQRQCELQRVLPSSAIHLLSHYAEGCTTVWSKGPDFDLALLASLDEDVSHRAFAPSWPYNASRDVRTLLEAAGCTDYTPPGKFTAHDALEDARYQALCVQEAWRRLGSSA